MPPLWQLDQDVFRAIHIGLHREWLDPLMLTVSASGLGYGQIAGPLAATVRAKGRGVWPWLGVVVLGVVAAGFAEKSLLPTLTALLVGLALASLPRPVAWCTLAAVVVSAVVRLAFVPLVARDRPSNLVFAHPLEPPMGSTSFPSGHATTAFAIATVLCWRYARSDDSWVAWAGLAWACAVGFSRVYVGVHYPLDVVAGAALGVTFGSLCFWVWQRRDWLSQEANTPMARNRS